jgi:hypothetical protein
MGGKMLAVPLTALTPSSDQKHLILNADKSKVETAMGFDSNNWPSVKNRFLAVLSGRTPLALAGGRVGDACGTHEGGSLLAGSWLVGGFVDGAHRRPRGSLCGIADAG